MGAKEYKGFGRHMFKQVLMCDWVGVAIVISWGVCFILAFQWAVSQSPYT